MSVWNRLGQFAKDVGGAVAAPAKFAWDIATSPFNNDEHFNGVANTLASATKNLGTSVLKPIADVVSLPGISQAVNVINTINQNVIREPLATTALAIGDTLGGKGNIFDPNEWKKAYQGVQNTTEIDPITGKEKIVPGISFGQAVAGIPVAIASDKFNIYDPKQRDAAFKDSMFGELTSGALDFGIQFAGDVTLGLGKGIKILKASEYGVGAIAGNADKAAHAAEQITKAAAGEKNRFSKLLTDFTKGDLTYALSHPLVRASNEPGLLAHLLGASKDEGTTALVLRTALGDQHAMNDLAALRPDITQAINNANKTIDEFDKFKANLASDAVIFPWEGPTVVAEAKAALEASIQHDEEVAKLMQIGAGGGSLTRTTGTILQGVEDFVAKARASAFYDKAVGSPIVKFYQATPFHRMYQVISHAEHERPAGLADVNDPDSYKEIVATIERGRKLAKLDEDQSKFHLDNYIKQVTPEGRNAAIHLLEQNMLVSIAKKHGLTEEHAMAIWQEVHNARTSATKAIREDGFMVDQDKGIIKSPIFESQTANFTPIMDFDLMNRLLKRHNSAISILGRTKDTTVHYADILQDAFKAAALLRGGYTIRNGIDSQLRIMASVGAMASIRHLGTGMKNMMFDSVKAPQSLVDQFKFLPSKTDKIADVITVRNGLTKEIDNLDSRIVELEGGPGSGARFHPDSVVAAREGAQSYAAKAGIPYDQTIDYKNLKADKVRAAKIADEYDKLPTYDKASIPQYKALIAEVKQQFDYMVNELGVKVEFVAEDPYKNSKEMMADVSQGRLKVLKTSSTSPHPHMTNEENDMFRAVHDYFGHAATGRGFAQNGEEAAWVHHSQMFSPDARAALTTETRGQNSWYNTRNKSAEQKLANLPKNLKFEYSSANNSLETKMLLQREHGINKQQANQALDAHTIIAKDKNGKYVGHISWNKETGKIQLVNVSSEMQRKGVATELFNQAKKVKGNVVKPIHETVEKNLSPEGAAWKKALTSSKFAEQKVAILPKEYHDITSDIARVGDTPLNADTLAEINTLKNLREEKTMVDSHYASLISRMSAKGYKTRMGTEGIVEHVTSDGQKYELYDAFGGPLGDMFRQLNSSASTYSRLMDSNSDFLSSKLSSKGIGAIKPDDLGYTAELANTLNRDFANSAAIRMLAKGMKPADVADWLKHDVAGQDLRKRLDTQFLKSKKSGKEERANLGLNYDEVDAYVAKINGFLDAYLPASNQLLRNKLAKREMITEQDIKAAHTNIDKADLPVIHGNVLAENIKNNSLISIKGITDGLFKFLGSMPEDAWARHPLYRSLYRDELKRRLDIMAGMKKDRLTPVEQEAAMKKAHEFAQRGVKNILFNIERRTNLATHLKFISPFFSAQENAVKTWAKMGINNPAIINRGAIIWNAPNRAGLVTDQNGNQVPAGQSTGQDTIWLEMPDWAKRLPLIGPGISVLDQQGIPKQSLDIIFSGGLNVLYGGKISVPFNDVIPIGPYVAIPASELAKRQPAFEDCLKWALPFGPISGPAYEGLLPAWVKRAQTLFAGQDSQEYVRTYQLIHTTELHNAKANGQPMPSESTIKHMTDDFYKMRIVANLVMPYSPKFDSPYRLYLDKYREYQRTYTGLGEADAMFLKDYPEFFDFAVSLSSNKTGALASQGTYANTKRYGDLVSSVYKDEPSLVGLITNNPTGNDFSQAVYDWQYATPVGPGTGDTFRTNANAQDAEKQNQVKLGWIKYRNVMNQIDAELANRGLSAINQKGAEDLNAIKQVVIRSLSYEKDAQGQPVLDANGQPSITPWFENYRDLDGTKTLRVITGLNKIVNDPKFLKDHTDAKGNLNKTWASVSTYLQLRQQLSNELASRPVKSLTAKANADINAVYEMIVKKLKDGNIGFGDIYDRYLSQDQIYYKNISDVALQGAQQ